MATVNVLDHPLIADKLSRMRAQTTSTATFRGLAKEIAFLMGYEALRSLETTSEIVTTPLTKFAAPVLAERDIAMISILRAGNGMLTGLMDLMPTARVGFVGLARNEETLQAEQYYSNLPKGLDKANILVCDPMLATGGSAADAIDLVKEAGGQDIKLLCLLVAPEGLEAFHKRHPDVAVFTAAIDSHLNDIGYIVPGLGDAGDRIFGTQ
ncbi:MAG: uracil phosphoribosyltransferase [Alphaproteobacteria bacterium]